MPRLGSADDVIHVRGATKHVRYRVLHCLALHRTALQGEQDNSVRGDIRALLRALRGRRDVTLPDVTTVPFEFGMSTDFRGFQTASLEETRVTSSSRNPER